MSVHRGISTNAVEQVVDAIDAAADDAVELRDVEVGMNGWPTLRAVAERVDITEGHTRKVVASLERTGDVQATETITRGEFDGITRKTVVPADHELAYSGGVNR